MSNAVTELSIAAKSDAALLLPLWESVRRFVCQQASRYCRRPETRLYEKDDLIQAGYLAMADAVAGFNPSAGMEFIGLLSYHLRTRFAEVIGRRGTKRRPELDALSLDVPIADDTDTTRADLLPDTAASEAFENAIDRETDRQDVAALLAEMPGILTELQRRALMLTAWDGLTFQAAAERMELTRQMVQQHRDIAARKISRTATARRIWTQRYAYRTQHVTLTGFRRTHTSEVERLILQLEEIEERSGFLP